MLDQNTDRMWFVIGAVIVGAAIIFIANGTLPTLFASVSDSFEDSATKGTEVIETISPSMMNLINIDDVEYGYWIRQTTGEPETASNGQYLASSGYIPVEENNKYVFKMIGGTSNNFRVSYYRSDQTFIKGFVKAYSNTFTEFETVAPKDAAFARISAPFTGGVDGHWAFTPVERWHFGKTF